MPDVSQDPLTDTVRLRRNHTPLRALVHKNASENVLLTGLRNSGDHHFTCTGRLPCDHLFFNHAGRTPCKDILFYTELGRQASLAISHEFLKASAEDVFIFERSKASLTDAVLNSAFQSVERQVVIDIAIEDMTRRRNGAVNRVVAQHSMFIDGEPVFDGTGAWTVQPAALFQRLRKSSRGSMPLSFGTGQGRPVSNTVIALPTYGDDRTSFASSLVVDYTHPYFFDHACDHIPGMVLLEGCAQLALVAFEQTTHVLPGRSAVRSYEMNFSQFVECGLPTTLAARVNAEDDVEIEISQPDVVCGTTTMRVAFSV